ncbi:TPA: winged helix-turn-helix domain-containing protein [Salmonella enterica subsp. salamae serovar 35:g,m,s,t:-]|nr:winged helix-turn-helix domain-containing protein [Salmonella enterica subsp. salamae serovar 35:g,m,s,t:-]HCA3549772.1 winged helix-turn-helix domain-containing protein [Salmonella enterica subsp. salamae serovar 35:g,m,s,t:-]
MPDYIVNDWSIDTAQGVLRHCKTGAIRKPGENVLRLLQTFAEHGGEIMPPYELIHAVWNSKPVGMNSLRVAIRALRVAIDDINKQQKVILNIPKKGYQLNPAFLCSLSSNTHEPEIITPSQEHSPQSLLATDQSTGSHQHNSVRTTKMSRWRRLLKHFVPGMGGVSG